jgi:large subunit ribosomal protein L21
VPQQRISAVIVSGGKQYRVAPGDTILVDRLAAEPGSEVTLDRVLLLDDGDDVRVGTPLVDGFSLTARVLAHQRGPKIDVLRYKSKKNVRVHKGARADLTALEILDPSGKSKTTAKSKAKAEATADKPAPKKRAAPKKASAKAEQEDS